MMSIRLCACAGCVASVAVSAAAQSGGPVPIDSVIEVSPERVARVRLDEGRVVRVGEWMEYDAGGARSPNEDLVFDCFYPTGTCDEGYWFLGTSYCNVFLTEDMTLHPATNIEAGLGALDLAWYWSCNAPPMGGEVEDCEIVVLTQESVPCEDDSFDYSGWILDYGSLECNPGGAYLSNVDLFAANGGTWTAPDGGVGSYTMMYTTSDGGALATCAQPLLWGTGDARGDPSAPGTQGPAHFADFNADGEHTDDECAEYEEVVCPNPLGAATAFWGEVFVDGCEYADCDRNNVIDTRDFTCFLNQWAPKNDAADCDGNGVVDTRDVTCFLNVWADCRP